MHGLLLLQSFKKYIYTLINLLYIQIYTLNTFTAAYTQTNFRIEIQQIIVT